MPTEPNPSSTGPGPNLHLEAAKLHRSQRFRYHLESAVIAAIVSLVVLKGCDKAAVVVYQLTGVGSPRTAIEGTVTLDVRPTGRRMRWSWFEFDRLTSYDIQINNRDTSIPLRASIVIDAGTGWVDSITGVVSAHMRINDNNCNTWSGSSSDHQVEIALDLPAPRTSSLIDIYVGHSDTFVLDRDVTVRLTYPGGLVEEHPIEVLWR